MDNSFFPFLNKSRRIVVGLMSGTSVDGIDAAVVAIEGQGDNISTKVLAFIGIEFEPAMRERIFHAFEPKNATVDMLGSLDMELGEVYAQAAMSAIKKAGLEKEQVDLICSHGQTIYHQPTSVNGRAAFTVQLGDGNVIAERTGISCLSDFRVADMAAGGQGAPLVPYTEFLLYRSESEGVLLQNIGGIGNVTVLPAGCSADQVQAFDTGPGNMVVDALISRMTDGRCSMDVGGERAAKGTVCEPLLNELTQHPYFVAPLPKTTGRELFGVEYTEKLYARAVEFGLSDDDILATATALTAESIYIAVRDFVTVNVTAQRLIVGGGGSYNDTLLKMLKDKLALLDIEVQTQEELGHSSDAKEAVAFALLGDCTLRGVGSSMPSVTGANYAPLLGKLSFATPR